MLQCVAVCCSVLQCERKWAQCAATSSHTDKPDVLQSVADCCSVLQCVAVCCSMMWCVAE